MVEKTTMLQKIVTENIFFQEWKSKIIRMKIKDYDIEIDEKTLDHQSINDSIKQYDEVRKISTGQGPSQRATSRGRPLKLS